MGGEGRRWREEDVSTPFLLESAVGGWWEQGGVQDLAICSCQEGRDA